MNVAPGTGQQIDTRLILGYYKHLLKLLQPFFLTPCGLCEIISRANDAVKIRAFINEVSIGLAVISVPKSGAAFCFFYLMKFLALGQHFQDNVHSLFAGLRFFGGLKPPGDRIFVGFVQRVKKSFCFFVFFKEFEKIIRSC